MSQTNSLPSNDHFISLGKAVDMTTLYRDDREAILATQWQNKNILPLSETFNRAAFDTLLAKEGCEGIRIYYGMDEDSKVHAVIVAVNEDNEDILPALSALTLIAEDIVEEGQRCPELCPPSSPLNE